MTAVIFANSLGYIERIAYKICEMYQNNAVNIVKINTYHKLHYVNRCHYYKLLNSACNET